ncbi:hypothetical protein PMAYCL1PPCAC_20986, partial [Pristionchus mayeri]
SLRAEHAYASSDHRCLTICGGEPILVSAEGGPRRQESTPQRGVVCVCFIFPIRCGVFLEESNFPLVVRDISGFSHRILVDLPSIRCLCLE